MTRKYGIYFGFNGFVKKLSSVFFWIVIRQSPGMRFRLATMSTFSDRTGGKPRAKEVTLEALR